MVSPEPERILESTKTECSDFLFAVQSGRLVALVANVPHVPEFCAPFFEPLRTGFPGHEHCRHLQDAGTNEE
jgi:hypothetical protein